jgi:hypothetical protein
MISASNKIVLPDKGWLKSKVAESPSIAKRVPE